MVVAITAVRILLWSALFWVVQTRAHRKPRFSKNITYELGAPVITNQVDVYYIYYGNWTPSQKALVEDFTNGLGASSWWGIMTKYYYQATASSVKIPIKGSVSLSGAVADPNYTLGRSLSGSALTNIIYSYTSTGRLPLNTQTGVYFVLTSSDVNVSHVDTAQGDTEVFCEDYCGFHNTARLQSGDVINYGHTGDATHCPGNGCTPAMNLQASPNGDIGVDAAVSVIAHELAEAVSNPDPMGSRAWQDMLSAENGDKCAFVFGETSTNANGASYNMGWGQRKFLVQQNWDPEVQACVSGYDRNLR
ncbi:hypothetical protein BATDEDRAFT_90662 [Batrachochytrium dendrobatidis JAM81]|uniref:Phosphate-induced protein 1 n=2 Tax=Batrachochytrium dendrobatidis TaxID=109871 RepID=F4P7X8_BATDJ|nr:uncharacterized protein BATDEDRAFT_90662 [Batrachochytrium dendrobatidis JAM81]EGF78468.1 hypothetical protein BATDEDRAFT_90662 [Batrachochytrium dendrobatidis JAM81]KAJ8324120.1 hypothetical protein O5D80_007326 [Batrachochytrium dendrobatidis]KAK5664914.1 hypothetical protein QVD99_008454 [Batrachochytrium dendrobatidis]OAJ43502.1 hypothetical protein BDEG_26857 [Batrachochytrium dendrobatidis JEL423]|eukprot:XP_006680855.1 hypothetical protein BATDEDRAFT_90662 [Batrachochytrium dendrobatidis JAM81]